MAIMQNGQVFIHYFVFPSSAGKNPLTPDLIMHKA
jgi:hypothetical protein